MGRGNSSWAAVTRPFIPGGRALILLLALFTMGFVSGCFSDIEQAPVEEEAAPGEGDATGDGADGADGAAPGGEEFTIGSGSGAIDYTSPDNPNITLRLTITANDMAVASIGQAEIATSGVPRPRSPTIH